MFIFRLSFFGLLFGLPIALQEKTVAQATASLYGVKTYPEQLAFKEKTLMDELFLTLPATIRLVQQHFYGSHVVVKLVHQLCLAIMASSG